MVLELGIVIAMALSYSYYPHVHYKKKIPEGFKEDIEGYFVSYGYQSLTEDKWESLGTKPNISYALHLVIKCMCGK